MESLQSLVFLFILVALAFSPMVVVYYRRKDDQARRPRFEDGDNVPPRLRIRAVVGRRMYGNAVGWRRVAMEEYDASPAVQALWENEARYKLEGR